MKTNYKFGKCEICGKLRSLKNGKCVQCETKNFQIPTEIPEFFKKMFSLK